MLSFITAVANSSTVSAQNGWDDPTTVTRKEKPRRRARRPRPAPPRNTRAPRPVVERAPLLAIQWRVLKINAAGTPEETNPTATFFPDDRLRLAVKANQSGYLYIIYQPSKDADGRILFPDSRINSGQNYVAKNQELIVPSICPAGISPRDCSYVVRPPAGAEMFHIIFSRDLLLDLPNEAAMGNGSIKPETLRQLIAESGQRLEHKSAPSVGRYTFIVRNMNRQDNEDLIETLVLRKGE